MSYSYECLICKKQLGTRLSFEDHEKTYHLPTTAKYSCPHCPYEVPEVHRSNLKRHLKDSHQYKFKTIKLEAYRTDVKKAEKEDTEDEEDLGRDDDDEFDRDDNKEDEDKSDQMNEDEKAATEAVDKNVTDSKKPKSNIDQVNKNYIKIVTGKVDLRFFTHKKRLQINFSPTT